MGILKRIKNKFLNIYIHVFCKNNTRKFVEIQFNIATGKKINLDNPVTFNDKINWLKVYYYNPLFEKCADKINVREYVKDKGLDKYLTKLYKVYNNVDEINLAELPDKFVIKTTHSSGGVAVVNSKDTIDDYKLEHIKEVLNESMKNNLYEVNREWQYKNLIPKIMVEELIEGNGPELNDYKFFCFNGKVEYVYVARGISTGDLSYYIDFYDKDWNWLDVRRVGHKNYGKIDKPKNFEEMKNIAEKLSKDFDHVRVDLYNENGRIYFGELTFTTAAGFGVFEPDSFDYELGEKWNITKNN